MKRASIDLHATFRYSKFHFFCYELKVLFIDLGDNANEETSNICASLVRRVLCASDETLGTETLTVETSQSGHSAETSLSGTFGGDLLRLRRVRHPA